MKERSTNKGAIDSCLVLKWIIRM